MEKKPCQLCDNLATMYCEPDQANLCRDCDSRVHGANFLAAKHSRNLHCRSCQSPTLWSASRPRLTPKVSVCEKCVGCGAWDDHSYATRSSHGGGDNSDALEIATEAWQMATTMRRIRCFLSKYFLG